jgi:hypothetical protein
MTREQLIGPPRGSGAVIQTFTAPRPLLEALRARADERGQSLSRVIRESLVDAGIVPTTEPTNTEHRAD